MYTVPYIRCVTLIRSIPHYRDTNCENVATACHSSTDDASHLKGIRNLTRAVSPMIIWSKFGVFEVLLVLLP
jgi:hypothetical protein